MDDKDILKIMLQKKECKTVVEKGEKFLIYGELRMKYDSLEVKKEKVYLFYKQINTAVIK